MPQCVCFESAMWSERGVRVSPSSLFECVVVSLQLWARGWMDRESEAVETNPTVEHGRIRCHSPRCTPLCTLPLRELRHTACTCEQIYWPWQRQTRRWGSDSCRQRDPRRSPPPTHPQPAAAALDRLDSRNSTSRRCLCSRRQQHQQRQPPRRCPERLQQRHPSEPHAADDPAPVPAPPPAVLALQLARPSVPQPSLRVFALCLAEDGVGPLHTAGRLLPLQPPPLQDR